MTVHQMGPPESEVPAPAGTGTHHDRHVDTSDSSRSSRHAVDARRAEHVDTDQSRQVEHVSVQLRRRREAAHRLPRLQDGRRDPISASLW